MYNEGDSLTYNHKITLDEAVKINQLLMYF